MSLINYLVPTRVRNFFTGVPEGTNQLATIADVNTVIDKLNKSNSNTYAFNTIVVNEILGVGVSAVGYAGGCTSPGSGCWSCLNSCSYQDSKAAVNFVSTAPGVYTLTVSPDPDMPRITGASIRIGSFVAPGHMATVTPLSALEFEIKTFDILSGTPTDPAAGILHDTPIDIIFYFAPTYNVPSI